MEGYNVHDLLNRGGDTECFLLIIIKDKKTK